MMPREDVLERNLELLFTRAYEPVEPSAAFRERLLRAIEDRIGSDRIGSASRKRSLATWRIAAGFLLLLGGVLLGWAIFARSSASSGAQELIVEEGSGLQETTADGGNFSGPVSDAEVTDPSLDLAPSSPTGRAEASLEGSAVAGSDRGSSGEPPSAAVQEPPRATLHGTLVLPPSRPEAARPEEFPGEFIVTLLRTVRLPAVSNPESHTFPLEAGEFVVDGLRAGTWAVFVQVEGFACSVTRGLVLAAGGTTELGVEVSPGTALRGRVVDAEGRPVEGATVVAEEETPMQILPFDLDPLASQLTGSAKSDFRGVFELLHVGAGPKILRATCPDHGAAWTEKVDPSAVDSGSGLEIRLARPGAIEGRVVRNDGTPWPGAMVVAAFLDPTFERACMSFGSAMTDAEGRYAISDLPPGAYVALNAEEKNPGIRQVQIEAGQRVTVDLPGTLTGTSLEGTLLSSDGTPLAGYDVTVQARGGNAEDWKQVRSDPAGRFHFPDLTSGVYDLFIGENAGIQFTRLCEIDVPAVPVFRPTIRAGTGSLRGKVTQALTGEALPVSVVILEVEREGAFEFAAKTVSDGGGVYTIDLLPAGRYRATAYATIGKFGQETGAEFEIGEPSPASVRDFALRPGADLTVRVIDPAGAPVHGAYVQFVDASGSAVSFSPSDVTDGQGILRARGMKPGRWTISALREPQGRASATQDLAADEERALELVLISDK